MNSFCPKVTIMIPTFNQAPYIGRCMESALAQDYPNLEVVVADDHSRDDTPKIVELYTRDSRVRFFRNEKNLGRVQNYRKLLYDYATGSWALNLDGDDYMLDSEFISSAIEAISEHDNVVLVGGGRGKLEGEELSFYRPTEKPSVLSGYEVFLSWAEKPINHLCSLYDRDLACKLDFYRNDIISSDWESILRLILHGNVVLTPRIVGVWQSHECNISTKFSIDEIFANTKFISAPAQYAIEKGYSKNKIKKWQSKMMYKYFDNALQIMIKRQDAQIIKKLFMRMCRETPISLLIFIYPQNFLKLISFKIPRLFGFLVRIKEAFAD